MLIATIVIWAFNITVTKYVLTHGFQPLAYGALRYGAAAILAVVVAVVLERSLRVGGRRSLAAGRRRRRRSCSSTRSRSSTR